MKRSVQARRPAAWPRVRRALCWGLAAGLPVLAQPQPAAPAADGPAGHPYAERYAAACAICHGARGHSETPLTPSLGGQPAFYAVTQLFLFREGRRDNAAMVAVGKTLSDDDLRGYSGFIATLPAPAPPAQRGDPARLARGQALARQHLCNTCHGADFTGSEQVARLAHQREDYLRLALRGYRAGTRPGYTPAMSEAVAGLQPEQLDDIAHYLAHLPR